MPTAIYCFLHSQRPEVRNCGDHPFQTTLEFVMMVGGDTDTIGAMACAIAGAYYGDAVIPKNMLKRLEDAHGIAELGEQLYEKVVKK